MGKETWLLLPKIPDWRWLLDRNNSPWYNSVKLFRQNEYGNWSAVINSVKEELSNKSITNNKIDLQKKIEAFEAHTENNYEKAEKLYKEILVDCEDAEVNFWLGNLYFQTNKFEDAANYLSEAIKLNKELNEEVYSLLFDSYKKLNKKVEVEEIYKSALSVFPSSTNLINNMALYYNEQGNKEKAIEILEQALEVNQEFPFALKNLGYFHNDLGNNYDSIYYLEKALNHYKDDIHILIKLADSYGKEEKFELAESTLKKALKIKNNDASIYNTIGLICQKQYKYNDAENYFKEAQNLEPLSHGVYFNLGNNAFFQHKWDEAEKFYNTSLELKEDFKDAKVCRGINRLLNENFEKGWSDFVASIILPEAIKKDGKVTIWKPVEGNNERVLVYSDQGAGDIIQFSRYLRLLKELNYTVVFECPKYLEELFKTHTCIDEIVIKEVIDYQKIDYKYYVPLLGLPAIFNTNLTNIPSEEKLFEVNTSKLLDHSKLNVGIVWSGNPYNANNLNRSSKVDFYEALFGNADVNFHSLQYNYESEKLSELLNKYPNFSYKQELLNNFINTAQLIKELDLVITIDTSIAHLAGTLGTETWVTAAYSPDWRWMLNRYDSPWYNSVKVYRQEKPGNWETVFQKLAEDLNDWSTSKSNKNFTTINNIDELRNLSTKYINLADYNNAINALEQLQEIEESASTYFDLAFCYQKKNKPYKALEFYQKTLELDPNEFNAYNNLGLILRDLKRFDDAEKALMLSLKIQPDNHLALNNLGIVEEVKGRFDEAIGLFLNAVKINPNYAEAYLNLANCFSALGQEEEATLAINKSIEINPNYVDAHFNNSLLLLKNKDFKNGLVEYEWRKEKSEYIKRNFSKPILDTKDLSGKKVLVYDEQGYGDTINFGLFIQNLKDLGAYVILECHESLSDLMKGCDGVDEVIARHDYSEPTIDYDYHIALLSLPLFFKTEYESIPQKESYINVERKYVDYWRGWFADVNKPKVGIVWEGKKPLLQYS